MDNSNDELKFIKMGISPNAEQLEKLNDYKRKAEKSKSVCEGAFGALGYTLPVGLIGIVASIAEHGTAKKYDKIVDELENHDEKVKYKACAEYYHTSSKNSLIFSGAIISIPALIGGGASYMNHHYVNKYNSEWNEIALNASKVDEEKDE